MFEEQKGRNGRSLEESIEEVVVDGEQVGV